MLPLTADVKLYLHALRVMGSRAYGVVYLFRNLENGKCYVGQTTEKVPYDRYFRHLKEARLGSEHPLYRAVRKYGKEAFRFEIVANCDDQKSLDAAEEFFIVLYNSLSPNGYNFRAGGIGGKRSADLKARLKKIHSSPTTSRRHKNAISKCWADPEHRAKLQATWRAKQPLIQKQRLEREAEREQERVRTRPAKIERRNAKIKAAHANVEVRKRVGAGTRGGKWIFKVDQADQRRRLKSGEFLPEGWTYGRGNTYAK